MSTKKPVQAVEPGIPELAQQVKKKFRTALAEVVGDERLEVELNPDTVRDFILRRLLAEREQLLDRAMGVEKSFGEIRITDRAGMFERILKPMVEREAAQILESELRTVIQEEIEKQRGKYLDIFRKEVAQRLRQAREWEMRRQAQNTVEQIFHDAQKQLQAEINS